MSTLGLIFCLLGSVFTKRRHFRPDPFLSCAERWQDSRAVRDSRGPCSERRPLPGKIFASCVPERRFAGLFGYMARISCQNQLISDAWRANLAANWRFSRPRPLSGCMERKTCHGLMPGNAPRRNLVAARPPRTHRARILPLPVRPRAHQGAILPPSDAGKRISRAFCHRQAPGKRIFATSCQRSGIFVRAGLLPCHSSRTA